jgi:hypothetical protein
MNADILSTRKTTALMDFLDSGFLGSFVGLLGYWVPLGTYLGLGCTIGSTSWSMVSFGGTN